MRTLVVILVLTLSLGAPMATADGTNTEPAAPSEPTSSATDSGDPGDCRPLCSSASSQP